jgi:hypothetical protein
MAEMNCQTLTDLARRFQPVLRFHPSERIFPALAEAWLSACSGESWGAGGAKFRGTALMRAATGDTAFGDPSFVRASCAGGAGVGSPIDDDRGNANNDIGNPDYAHPADMQDAFLDFGGWDDPVGFSTCSPAYLAEVFSGLGSAINPTAVTEVPLDRLTSTAAPTTFGTAQPKQPTVYAEVEWAGMFPRIDKNRPGEQKDFAHPDNDVFKGLDSYVAVTYYYLYPSVEPPPKSAEGVRKLEGQWEAITVFLKGDQGGAGAGKRPRDFSGLEPRFVTYSRGFDNVDSTPLPASCRPWDDQTLPVEKDGEHPIAYVSAGTHRNFFVLDEGSMTNNGATGGSTVITATNIGTPNPLGSYIMMGGAALIAASVFAGPFGPAVLILGIIVFVIGLLVLAFTGGQAPPAPEDPPKNEPTQPGQEDVATDGTGPAGVPPGTAKPTQASGSVDFTLRVIDRFYGDLFGGFPPAGGSCELPPWWDYGGRWGVKLGDPNSPGWDSGSRRADRFERSRGYWNARELVWFVSQNPKFQL